jgi:ADP-ribosylglycohydrolase
MATVDQYLGSVLGHALGDAIGARHEGGAVVGYVWSKLVGSGGDRIRWTDDTEMNLALMESLLEHDGLNQDALARLWSDRYTGWRGYGPGAAKILKRIRKGEDWRTASRSVYPDGSYGNGAAMRAGPIGLWCPNDADRRREFAEASAVITHAHPLGVDGAILIADAIALALRGTDKAHTFCDALEQRNRHREYHDRIQQIPGLLSSDPGVRKLVRLLGNGVAAHESVVTAVYAALRFREESFQTMMAAVIRLGGDTDTIGAMAGGIWGAWRGVDALPAEELDRLEDVERIRDLAHRLYLAIH